MLFDIVSDNHLFSRSSTHASNPISTNQRPVLIHISLHFISLAVQKMWTPFNYIAIDVDLFLEILILGYISVVIYLFVQWIDQKDTSDRNKKREY